MGNMQLDRGQDADQRAAQLQDELDRCRGLVRMLGVQDFGSLEEGIRLLAIGDGPPTLEFMMSDDEVAGAIDRIERTTTRLQDDPCYRSAVPFDMEIMMLALSVFAARLQIDPHVALTNLHAQFLSAMHHHQHQHQGNPR